MRVSLLLEESSSSQCCPLSSSRWSLSLSVAQNFFFHFSPIPACLLLFQDMYYLGHSHCLTVDNNFPQASIGLCASLQATFYPLEAAKKGSTPAQFGAVFGIIHLSLFVFGPLVGKYLPLWGVHCIFFAGFVIDGGSFLLFGLLQWVDDNTSFLVLAHIHCKYNRPHNLFRCSPT